MKLSPRIRFILYAACGYLIFGSTWIFLSDRLLMAFTDISAITSLSTAKGIAFILLTTLLLVLALCAIPDHGTAESQNRYRTSQFLILTDQLPRWVAYVFAVAVTLAMLLVRMKIAVAWGERPLLVLFMPPIILSSVLGGFGPGLIATAVASIGIYYFGLSSYSLHITKSHDLFQWFMLIVSGILSSYLSELLHRARRQSEERRMLQEIAQEEMRKSEARFSTIFHASPMGIDLVQATDERITHANAAFLQMLGYSKEEIIGRTSSELGLYVDPADRIRLFARIREGQRVMDFETQLRRKSGETGTFLIYVEPIEIGEEQLALSIIIDITHRKMAEAALQESEQNFRNLADSGQALIWTSGTDQLCNYFNRVWLEFTGRTLEQETGNGWTQGVHPDDMQRCLDIYVGAFERREKFSMEYRLRRCDGQYRWLMDDGCPRYDSKGEFIGYIGHCLDITERKIAEADKAKLEGQLQQAQKMEFIGRLAGGVAHDFNNMLSIILGHAEMALDQVDLSQPLHDDIEEIRKAANRSADLTRQLLAFARKQTISPKVLDLNETVEGMLKMLRRLIGEDIALTWQPGMNLWQVRVDPSQIDQILANLCINARDAISGVGKMTIETANRILDEEYCASHPDFTSGEYVRLTVSDNGCGMDREMQAHIFEPFFTTKEIGKGTGLGLATVFGIVKQNNGFINVYSEPGNGTTFTIYLPRHVAISAKKQKTAPAEIAVHGTRNDPAGGG